MKEITIKAEQSNQRLDKFIKRYMNDAPNSFIYKMLRKKNIVLNGKRAEGSEILSEGDIIKLFLSDDTINGFTKQRDYKTGKLDIIYEDDDMAVLNKPPNLLTQPDTKNGDSLITRFIATRPNLDFAPVCISRLDRNTSGIVLCAKNLHTAQKLSQMMKEGNIKKYYIAIVKGNVKNPVILKDFHQKDKQNNKVIITKEKTESSKEIITEIYPIKYNPKTNTTALKIKLITGKTHQIRAHLAYINHPIIGDIKYGKGSKGSRQLLHAYEVHLLGKTFVAPLPSDMRGLYDGY